MLTILEGSTFCICDESGDVRGGTSGLFAEDTRYLSRLEVSIDGKPPLLLSSGRVEYFSAAFFLRNDVTERLGQDCVAVDRRRFVGEAGMADTFLVQNVGMEPIEFPLGIAVGTDFADILSVKERDFALGHPDRAPALPPPARAERDAGGRQVVLAPPRGPERTQILLSCPCTRFDDESHEAVFDLALRPGEVWQLRLDVVPAPEGRVAAAPIVEVRFGTELEHVSESLEAWQMRVPRVRSDWRNVEATIGRSVADLASLRMRSKGTMGRLPAAGMPWFMTVFGRDTIITCLQTFLFGPELASSALEGLAALQATEDYPSIDAEPGKIVH